MSIWFIGALVFAALGARWAVMSRARADLARTQAAIPGMRVTARAAVWAMVRVAVLLLVVAAGLVVWQVKGGAVADWRHWLDRVRPSPQVSPSPPAATGGVDPRQVTGGGRVVCFSADCRRKHPE